MGSDRSSKSRRGDSHKECRKHEGSDTEGEAHQVSGQKRAFSDSGHDRQVQLREPRKQDREADAVQTDGSLCDRVDPQRVVGPIRPPAS